MKISKKKLIKLIENALGPDKIEKPGTGSETSRNVYDRTGKNIGYSPVQDIDKLIEPILLTGPSMLNPAVAGYYVGSKTITEIISDIQKMYKKHPKTFNKKLGTYITDKGIDKAINMTPVGTYLQKIPGYKNLKGTGKKAIDAVFKKIEDTTKEKVGKAIKSKDQKNN